MEVYGGSLVNSIHAGDSSAFADLVKVGDGATVLHYTDRSAATVVEVTNGGKRVGIVGDKATRVDNNGMSDSQRYTYERGTGATTYYTLRKNGRYVREGDNMRTGEAVRLGVRDTYHDYSF